MANFQTKCSLNGSNTPLKSEELRLIRRKETLDGRVAAHMCRAAALTFHIPLVPGVLQGSGSSLLLILYILPLSDTLAPLSHCYVKKIQIFISWKIQ